MSFSNKLNQLMNTFSINNSKLAKGINVDPSLVSRWRTGSRYPAQNSPHIPAIAAFFLELDAIPFQKDFMDSILLTGGYNYSSNRPSAKVQALINWLMSEPKQMHEYKEPKTGRLAAQTDIINRIVPASLTSKVIEDLPVQHVQGHLMEYELFIGREGKRQAVLNFLTTVINSKTQLKLLLSSEEDITWLTEDPEFIIKWAGMLKAVIDRGHDITIVHVVNRDISEIMSILNYWIPLHLYGTLHSYYYPKYVETPIKQTYFIIKGMSSIVSYDTHEKQLENCSFYFKDSFITTIFENNMQAHLTQCKPLVKAYSSEDWMAFLEDWLVIEAYSGCTYSIGRSFSGLFMPETLLKKCLKIFPDADCSDHSSLIDNWKTKCLSNLQFFKHYEILPVGLLDDIIYRRTYVHSDIKYLGNITIEVEVQDILKYLQNIVEALKTYDNYELYFTNHLPGLDALDVNISFKENVAASFFTTAATRNNYAAVVVDEGNIVQTLSYYFDDYIQQIPSSNRNKKEIIRKLEKAIAVLQSL